MTVVLSAFYAKLLIVLGLALPVTSTIQNELYTNLMADVSFFLYLTFVICFKNLKQLKKNFVNIVNCDCNKRKK